MRVIPVQNCNTLKPYKIDKNRLKTIGHNEGYENKTEISRIYYGKDIVSFKSESFENTLQNNYYHLPAGAKADEFQIDAGKAINAGKNVIVEAPTGTGKTAIAYYSASKNMQEGKKTFYTTPLKALSNQKLNELKSIYGEENAGILTGDRREMTTEVYRNMALSKMYGEEVPLMDNLGSVILDECHYLGDLSRGQTWEESVMLTPDDVQILALSATIGNSNELTSWMGDIKGKEVHLVSVPSTARAVPLEYNEIYTNSYKEEEKRIQRSIKKNGCITQDFDITISPKPSLSDYKHAVETVLKRGQMPAIIFIFSRKFSKELLEYLSLEGPVLTTKEEQKEIEKIINKYKTDKYIGQELDTEALKKGYAVHNAGIVPNQKEMIEELFQKKLIKTVLATETLAAGINMPAKTVIISNVYKPDDEEDGAGLRVLTPNEFKQMAGRAGRRGIDTAGYVYTMPADRNSEQEFLMLEAVECNSVKSRYNPEYSFLTGYFKYNDSVQGLNDIFEKSFYAKENENGTDKLNEAAEAKLKVLEELNFIRRYGDKTENTILGEMVSKVRGYNIVGLIQAINDKEFEEITPESLAMIAGSIANPADPKEKANVSDTGSSCIFDNQQENIEFIYKELHKTLRENLKRLGKKEEDFSCYEEMADFINYIDKPDISVDILRDEIERLKTIRADIYTILKDTGKYSLEELVNLLKNGEKIPNKVLEKYLEKLNNYKSKIRNNDINSYIEKLDTEIEQIDVSAKGNKAKARNERKIKEIEQEINTAKLMKYLDEEIINALSSNQAFLKKNPPERIKSEYANVQRKYAILTAGDDLINKIRAVKQIEEYAKSHDIKEENCINSAKIKECSDKIKEKNIKVKEIEEKNGIKTKEEENSIISGEILYSWAYLNKINPDSMGNWQQLIKTASKNDMDEGTIYRKIMQTSDLLSQIKDIAQAGIENSDVFEDIEYYKNLKYTATEARNLIIREPIEP